MVVAMMRQKGKMDREREAVMDTMIEAADGIRMEKKKEKNLDAINKGAGGQLYCPETTKKEETRYYPAE